METFDDQRPRRGWLGYQTYLILVGKAANHQLVTYEEMERLLGHPIFFLGQNALWPVAAWCLENKLPPLTVLVISKHEGKAGEGFPDDPARIAETALYPWHTVVPPTPQELDDAWRHHDGQDV